MKRISEILLLLMLTSCVHKQGVMLSSDNGQPKDSSLLRVAVMPTWGCLPLYYAEQHGMTEGIELVRYKSQMDIDTALVNGHVQLAYTDMFRAMELWRRGCALQHALTVYEPMYLVSQKKEHGKKETFLKEKMVAISRLSITDYLCDVMVDSSEVKDQKIYRPQINDVTLRAEMMRTDLMDAAILPEPYAAWMKLEGKRILKRTTQDDLQFIGWYFKKNDSICTDLINNFITLYRNAAVEVNRAKNGKEIREILKAEYSLPAHITDSLKLSAPKATKTGPDTIACNTARQWLDKRGRPTPATMDSLFSAIP